MSTPERPYHKSWVLERVIMPNDRRHKHRTHLALAGDSQTLCLVKMPRRQGETLRTSFDPDKGQPTCTQCWGQVRHEFPVP